jgi:hypothetical protein
MYSQIAANKRRTVLIMFIFLLFIGGLSWLFGNLYGRELTYVIVAFGIIYAVVG